MCIFHVEMEKLKAVENENNYLLFLVDNVISFHYM